MCFFLTNLRLFRFFCILNKSPNVNFGIFIFIIVHLSIYSIITRFVHFIKMALIISTICIYSHPLRTTIQTKKESRKTQDSIELFTFINQPD